MAINLTVVWGIFMTIVYHEARNVHSVVWEDFSGWPLNVLLLE